MDERLIRSLEALRVGPGEVLILRIVGEEWSETNKVELAEALAEVGLSNRVLVIEADGIEMAVVPREAAAPAPDPKLVRTRREGGA